MRSLRSARSRAGVRSSSAPARRLYAEGQRVSWMLRIGV
jgi:hypothetical protein